MVYVDFTVTLCEPKLYPILHVASYRKLVDLKITGTIDLLFEF